MALKDYLRRGAEYILKGVPIKNITASISLLAPNNQLYGKKIIITGGGRGLGYSMAKKFIAEGAQVIISGRNETTLQQAASQLNCKYLTLDINDIDNFNTFIEKADKIFNGINCLVNNAGISLHEGNIRNVTETQFDNQIKTNLKGGYFLSQSFIKYIESKNIANSNILFISSERGIYVDDLPYGMTKAAINSFIQGLAYRVISSGIRVNAIAPGITASDMTGYKADENLYCNCNTNKRIYLPEEVAEIASFLLSDISKCLVGQILVCNEGKSINAAWK